MVWPLTSVAASLWFVTVVDERTAVQVVSGLTERRHLVAVARDRLGAGVVRGQGELLVAGISVEESTQIGDTAPDILRGVVRVPHMQVGRRGRHQLHQAHRALRGSGPWIKSRLDLDDRPHQLGPYPMTCRLPQDDRTEAATGDRWGGVGRPTAVVPRTTVAAAGSRGVSENTSTPSALRHV